MRIFIVFKHYNKLPAPPDTFSNLTNVNPADSSTTTTNYTLSENGIAWPGESKKYVTKPAGDISQLAPPPNWALRFPDGYNDSNIPDLKSDEHFQNWMRTAGLPTFTKLWARNDVDTLQSGTYQIVAYMSAWSPSPFLTGGHGYGSVLMAYLHVALLLRPL